MTFGFVDDLAQVKFLNKSIKVKDFAWMFIRDEREHAIKNHLGRQTSYYFYK